MNRSLYLDVLVRRLVSSENLANSSVAFSNLILKKWKSVSFPFSAQQVLITNQRHPKVTSGKMMGTELTLINPDL